MSDEVPAGQFSEDMLRILPKLRVYALSLTRDRDRADDLVQSLVVQALTNRTKFRADTNLAAWLFRLQRNLFITELRRTRDTISLDGVLNPDAIFARPPTQGTSDMLHDFMARLRLLPREQRDALLLAAYEGLDYDAIAVLTGVSIGTVKSRVSRGRAMMTGAI